VAAYAEALETSRFAAVVLCFAGSSQAVDMNRQRAICKRCCGVSDVEISQKSMQSSTRKTQSKEWLAGTSFDFGRIMLHRGWEFVMIALENWK
jgi:hypothetical protein